MLNSNNHLHRQDNLGPASFLMAKSLLIRAHTLQESMSKELFLIQVRSEKTIIIQLSLSI